MNSKLATAVANFRRGESRAQAVLNGQKTEVEILFSRKFMEIRNLEELPAYVRLPFESPRGNNRRYLNSAQLSEDGTQWDNLDEETAEFLQIYRVLDPAIVIPHTEFSTPTSDPIRREFELYEGFYNIADLGLPDAVAEVFSESNRTRRRIQVVIFNNTIVETRQEEVPPSNDYFSLEFTGISALG